MSDLCDKLGHKVLYGAMCGRCGVRLSLAPSTQVSELQAKLAAAEELSRVRGLLRRWWEGADAGALDGVDLDLMVECDEYFEAIDEREVGNE